MKIKNYIVYLNNDRKDTYEIIIPGENYEQAEKVAEAIISGEIDKYDFRDTKI